MLPTPSILTSFRWGQERRSQPGGLGKEARSNTVWLSHMFYAQLGKADGLEMEEFIMKHILDPYGESTARMGRGLVSARLICCGITQPLGCRSVVH